MDEGRASQCGLYQDLSIPKGESAPNTVGSCILGVTVSLSSLLGPYWTHILFTWKSKEGLKVYVNGTLSTSDPSGKVSHRYGEPSVSLVLGSEQDQARRGEQSTFDEFIIWERALTPDEIAMYFTAAIGQYGPSCPFSVLCQVTPTSGHPEGP